LRRKIFALGRNFTLPKHPRPSDFEVEISEADVQVIFILTRRRYIFHRFVDRKDIIEFGRLSPDPQVAHAKQSGTGVYLAPEVRAMAFRLASEALRRT
jgi:hypothetical protein